MNLLQQLSLHYPDWRKFHDTAIDAAVEVGLLDEADLALEDYPELDFEDNDYTVLDEYMDDYDNA